MKKVVCLILSLAILLSFGISAYAATDYSDLISSVLDDMSSNNARCSGAPQQSANGAYRLVEMLAIIAMENDTSGTYSDVISSVLDDMSANNARCSGAPQQTANGAYRCVEMLAIIAMECDSCLSVLPTTPRMFPCVREFQMPKCRRWFS